MFVASDGADIVLASHHDGGELANVSRHRRFLSKAASSAIRRGAGPERQHGVLVLPRLPRVDPARGLRRARRHPDPRARLRLQGRAADQALAPRRARGRGPRDARLGQARGREQDARAADHGRLRAHDDAPGRLAEGVPRERRHRRRRPARPRDRPRARAGGRRGRASTRPTSAWAGSPGSTKIGGVAVDRYYHVRHHRRPQGRRAGRVARPEHPLAAARRGLLPRRPPLLDVDAASRC